MTFKSEKDRQEALRIILRLQQTCTSDAQYRVYAAREEEFRSAKIRTRRRRVKAKATVRNHGQ